MTGEGWRCIELARKRGIPFLLAFSHSTSVHELSIHRVLVMCCVSWFLNFLFISAVANAHER